MNSKKMTTIIQFELMVSFLEDHPEMVTGKYGISGYRISVNELWSELTEELNSNGPPTRTKVEWRKVWADLKNIIRKKLRQKLLNKDGNDVILHDFNLRPLEERIVNLTGMLSLGIDGSLFGPETTVTQTDPPKPKEEPCTDSSMTIPVDPLQTESPTMRQKKKQKKRRHTPSYSLLMQEVIQQRKDNQKMFAEIRDALVDISETNKLRLEIERERLELEKQRRLQ